MLPIHINSRFRQVVFGLCGVVASLLCEYQMELAAQSTPGTKVGTQNIPTKADAVRPTQSLILDNADLLRLMQTLVKATSERDPEAVSALIDSERMFAEIQRLGIISTFTPGETTALRTALQLTLGQGLIDEGAAGEWKGIRIQGVTSNPNGLSTVAVLMLDKSGRQTSLMKFWLTGGGKAWKIFDWQAGNSLFRTSTMVAVTVGALRGDSAANEMQHLIVAARDASKGELEATEEILGAVSETRFPDALEAARWFLEAQVATYREQPEKALQCLDLAEKHDRDIIVLLKTRSAIYADLGNPTKSLELAEQAIKACGDDADAYLLIGNALAKLDQGSRAVNAYQKGLDTDPQSLGNLTGLAEVLPAGKKETLIARFDRLVNRNTAFPTVADALVNSKNKESLRLIVESANKWAIDEAIIEYYTGELLVLHQKVSGAARHFNIAIARTTDNETKDYYRTRLLNTYLDAKVPLDAYRDCDDALYGLEFLVPRLLEKEDAAGLLAVTEAHQQRVPDDPAGYFYAGQAHLLAKHFDLADKSFAEGMKRTTDVNLKAKFRSNRIYARFKLGQAIETFEEFGSERATFDQLARLLTGDNQSEPLLKMVALQRKNEPGEPSLDAWEADAHSLAKDYSSAIKILEAAIDRSTVPDIKRLFSSKLIVANLAAKKPLDAYAAAPDSMQAFGFICENLLSDSDAAGLQAVIAAHRGKYLKDLTLHYYAGKVHLLNKDYQAAAKEFAAGNEDSRDAEIAARFSYELMLAACKAGEAVSLYREAADKLTAFDTLAPILAENGQANDLESLVKAHREQFPKFALLGSWEAEACWLRKDDKGTIEILNKHRDSILSDEALIERFDDRLVRSLVRLKDFDEALNAAKASTIRDGDPWFEAVVYVAKGDVTQSESALKQCLAHGYAISDFEADSDMGDPFKSSAFEAVRRTLTGSK